MDPLNLLSPNPRTSAEEIFTILLNNQSKQLSSLQSFRFFQTMIILNKFEKLYRDFRVTIANNTISHLKEHAQELRFIVNLIIVLRSLEYEYVGDLNAIRENENVLIYEYVRLLAAAKKVLYTYITI
jgi:hypothetical protein